VTSLRRNVLVGAALWTIGLLAVWAVGITLYGGVMRSVIRIHSYPHTLGVIAILSMIAGFHIVRVGLRPLDRMRERLAAVRAGSARHLDGDYPAEVQPLVGDLNALLTHQEAAVSRAAAKAADLAHGLKTPLAILAHEAERAAAAGQPDLASAIREQVERMRRQIDYHLAHARAAASGAMPGAHCNVAESAEALGRTLSRLHAERGLAIDVQVDPSHAVRCRREDLDEMLGNLLDNACKWAHTRVEVRTATAASHLAIDIDDDGSGLDAALREKVLQRGVRADEAAPGSGIGLAIVRELADLYGGSIVLAASPLGGLRATLTLPVAS
jgi:signal transduction histidine kinase